eukprot:gene19283-6548_t
MSERRGILAQIDACTKWWVLGTVVGVTIFTRDDHVVWAVAGSVVSSANCVLVLKPLFNQKRPDNAEKLSAGMPSSHAQALSYLGTYAAIGLHRWLGAVSAALTFGLAMFLSWLRVQLGFHSMPQFVVGFTA